MNDTYMPSDLNIFMHSIPRLSFNFVLNQYPEFSLSNSIYLEGILTSALLPAVILLVTLLGFLIYYCCIPFKRERAKKTNKTWNCSTCLIFFLVVVALCGVGVAIHGSLNVRHGIAASMKAVSDTAHALSSIAINVKDINLFMDSLKFQTITLSQTISNNDKIQILLKLSEQLQVLIFDFPSHTEGVVNELETILSYIQKADSYRFMVTFSLIGLTCFVCLLAFFGVCFRSKCCLVSTTFTGQLCLVGLYVYIGLVFMIIVGVADLCINPLSYFSKTALNKLPIDNSTVTFYQHCIVNKSKDAPYLSVISDTKDLLIAYQTTVEQIEKEEIPYKAERLLYDLNDDCKKLHIKLDHVKYDFKCEKFKEPLNEFVPSFCVTVFQGLAITIASMFSMCLALTAMLCAAPKAWKRFSKKPPGVIYDNTALVETPSFIAWTEDPINDPVTEVYHSNSRQIPMALTKKLPPLSCESSDLGKPPPYSSTNSNHF